MSTPPLLKLVHEYVGLHARADPERELLVFGRERIGYAEAERRVDGNLAIVGRLSQMFKSGGYNVYPREIELALEAHPAEGSQSDPDALVAFLRERLANYKVPKRLFVVDALPMLPIGKVDKVALRERSEAVG